MAQVVTSKVWFGTYFSYIMLHQWQMYVGIQYWWQRHSLLHECVCRRVCCISILLWILWRESQVLLVTNLSSARHLRTPVALTLKPRSQHVNWTELSCSSRALAWTVASEYTCWELSDLVSLPCLYPSVRTMTLMLFVTGSTCSVQFMCCECEHGFSETSVPTARTVVIKRYRGR